MNFLQRLFGSKPAHPIKPAFDSSVAQRLVAAGKDPNRVHAVPAELLVMPEKPVLVDFHGTVRLELTLDQGGKVVSVKIDGAPFNHVSILESWAHGWAFSPARMDAKAHPCRMVFEVTWV